MTNKRQTRIALVHALAESVEPIHRTFAELWPNAYCFDVLDTSLSDDLASGRQIGESISARISSLAHYAARAGGVAGETAGILFTCSAFGTAIDAVKPQLSIPVLRPNEAAFEEALGIGGRIAVMTTFAPSLPALKAELQSMAAARDIDVDVTAILVDGALAALKAGDAERHDLLAVKAASALPPVDVVVLGQFSLARAAMPIRAATGLKVLTTPASAVKALKTLIDPS